MATENLQKLVVYLCGTDTLFISEQIYECLGNEEWVSASLSSAQGLPSGLVRMLPPLTHQNFTYPEMSLTVLFVTTSNHLPLLIALKHSISSTSTLILSLAFRAQHSRPHANVGAVFPIKMSSFDFLDTALFFHTPF